MSSIFYPVARFSELTRQHGLNGALSKAGKRAADETTLYAREAWWSLRGRRLPAEGEILAKASGNWASMDDLVRHLCGKDSPAFVFSAEQRDRLVARWQDAFPGSGEATLSLAEEICNLRFDMLGCQFQFDENGRGQAGIDWHRDAASGDRWPLDYIERIDRWMWTDQRPGDFKPLWELNRHQYLVVLGKAYWLTGDERYAETCALHLQSWIEANPYPFGINWYSALEVGVRLIAWGLALHFVRDSRRFAGLAGGAVVRSVYQQARFLREHLTLDWEGRNNHIIGEAAALAYTGALFDEFVEAEEWLETGLRIVEAEVVRQTHPDGVNREQAPFYQRFVLDFVLLLLVLARRGAVRPLPALEAQAERMLEYVMYALTPGGDLPALGDSDDGRGFLLDAGSIQESFRGDLSIGAVLFRRPDFKYVAREFGEQGFWLLGEAGVSDFVELESERPDFGPVAFPQGGHYVLRSDWTAKGDYALMRCGEFGLAGEGYCAHSHCDLLSPVLWIAGRPLLVDSGTYTYHGPWRDRFRATAAHNTVIVDGKEQAIPTGPFSWQQVPAARCDAWEENRVVGSMLPVDGVTFSRELVYGAAIPPEEVSPGAHVWLLVDRFKGEGTHQIEWAFHLAPGLVLEALAPGREPGGPGKGMRIRCDEDLAWAVDLAVPDVELFVEDGWVSYRYGERQRAQVIRASWQGSLDVGSMPPEDVSFRWQFALAPVGNGNEERA